MNDSHAATRGIARGARWQWRRWQRGLIALFRGLALEQLMLRSMALSFASLLSMVPLLAFSFSVLKGFGAHNHLEPLLDEFMAPLGDGGAQIVDHIIEFVENINVGVLGFTGLLLLIFTVVSLIRKIEDAFNYIWYLRRSRSLVERLRDYLSIVLIGPLVIVSVIGLLAALQQAQWVLELSALPVAGPLLVFGLQQAPLLLVFAAFTFFYALIPNTRVEWRAALGGAVLAGILWLSAGWAFATFAASSAQYTAVYSGFAVMILFLIWLNLNWILILIGAAISFYLQYPAHLRVGRDAEPRPSARTVERATLQILVLVARDHRRGAVCWDRERLARALGLPHTVVGRITAGMVASGLLVRMAGEGGCFLPGRESECMSLREIVQAARGAGDNFGRQYTEPAVQRICEQLEACAGQELEGLALVDLVGRPSVGAEQGS